MKSAIIACLLLILALGLVGCQSSTARYCPTTPPRPLRSTVFNTVQHQAIAQTNGYANIPSDQTWYYSRRDNTPSVAAGYITEQSSQTTTITRNRNSSQKDDYNQTTYTRRRQTVTW
ncbi:MAG TPA: hypothetical protein DCM28_16180 [Phycisphaerales bacterium]|nr:hypothetical protein [Phycisphaerales bacterium]HCD35111.1 hypothetical protein [Phycisphaerales bacterium]|tara:strand:- start:114 stop:464 length:351 start_codon:yes stop_codon:yes gene_type:complete